VSKITHLLARLRRRKPTGRPAIEIDPPKVIVGVDLAHIDDLTGVVWGLRSGETDGKSLEAEWHAAWQRAADRKVE
jgi:phage terminase large subunit-like protein